MNRLLLALACGLWLFAGMAQAQDVPNTAEPEGVCAAAFRLYAVLKGGAPDPKLLVSVALTKGRLDGICGSTPSSASFEDGLAADWLADADEVAANLAEIFTRELERPGGLTVAARSRVTALARIHGDLQTSLNLHRAVAYTAVRVETRTLPAEVIRVPVAAPCPEPVSPRTTCSATLRSAAGRWANTLYEFAGVYSCQSCDDWQFAKDTAPSLRSLSNGGSTDDPLPFMVGWLAQYRQLAREERRYAGTITQTNIDDRVRRVAADMRAQLSLCGMASPDWDR